MFLTKEVNIWNIDESINVTFCPASCLPKVHVPKGRKHAFASGEHQAVKISSSLQLRPPQQITNESDVQKSLE